MGSKARTTSRRKKKCNIPPSKLNSVKDSIMATNNKIDGGALSLIESMWPIFKEKRPHGYFQVSAANSSSSCSSSSLSDLHELQSMVAKKVKKKPDFFIMTPDVDADMKVVDSDDTRAGWYLSDYTIKKSRMLHLIRKTASIVWGTPMKKIFAQVLGSSGEQKVSSQQALHADNRLFFTDVRVKKKPIAHMQPGDVPYNGLLSLDDCTYLLLYDTVSCTETTVHILPGHMFVWRGDVFHAGAACPSSRIMFCFTSNEASYVLDPADSECVYLDYCLHNDSGSLNYHDMPILHEKAMHHAKQKQCEGSK
jgi:hypothetical protein